MQLTEQIQLKSSVELSRLCHLAKNLYNLANFHVRQFFFNLEELINYYDLQVILKNSNAYKSLPAQTSQQILKLVDKNWKSFFRALKEWKKDKSKFLGRPKPPNYKKKNGESIVIFTNQNARIKDNCVQFPRKCDLKPIKTRITEFQQIRIVPKNNRYILEIIYEKEEQNLGLNKNNCLSIDLGVNNLITSANNIGLNSFIVKGRVVKSINQFYNKQRALYQSKTNKCNLFVETNRLNRLSKKRENKIKDYFHKTSKYLINYCIKNDVGTIVIGYNELWKQKINIGKINDQNFVSIPFYRLIEQIECKSKLIGMDVVKTEESYTSKCSFLDEESIEFHSNYKGKRVKRGLFRASDGRLINADVNGAYNVLKKAFPKSLKVDGIEAVVLQPQIISVS